VTSTVSHVPGAGAVKSAFEGVLDSIGNVSPRARRVAVYTGAGLLGAAGVIDWPLAAAGAAAVWLTQPRPHHNGAAPAADGGRGGRRTDAAKEASGREKASKPAAKATRTSKTSRTRSSSGD
jgi:hypothetical protein